MQNENGHVVEGSHGLAAHVGRLLLPDGRPVGLLGQQRALRRVDDVRQVVHAGAPVAAIRPLTAPSSLLLLLLLVTHSWQAARVRRQAAHDARVELHLSAAAAAAAATAAATAKAIGAAAYIIVAVGGGSGSNRPGSAAADGVPDVARVERPLRRRRRPTGMCRRRRAAVAAAVAAAAGAAAAGAARAAGAAGAAAA